MDHICTNPTTAGGLGSGGRTYNNTGCNNLDMVGGGAKTKKTRQDKEQYLLDKAASSTIQQEEKRSSFDTSYCQG